MFTEKEKLNKEKRRTRARERQKEKEKPRKRKEEKEIKEEETTKRERKRKEKKRERKRREIGASNLHQYFLGTRCLLGKLCLLRFRFLGLMLYSHPAWMTCRRVLGTLGRFFCFSSSSRTRCRGPETSTSFFESPRVDAPMLAVSSRPLRSFDVVSSSDLRLFFLSFDFLSLSFSAVMFAKLCDKFKDDVIKSPRCLCFKKTISNKIKTKITINIVAYEKG